MLSSMLRIAGVSLVGAFTLLSVSESAAQSDRKITATFSIAAVDPATGQCGAAVASRYPAVGKVVPYVRAGVGAFCTQHWHHPPWGEKALDLLQQGKQPEAVLVELLHNDKDRNQRQLGIVDMQGRAANLNPTGASPKSRYWGSMAGRYYTCQGNTLTGREVIVAMAQAYEETKGSLADRLMAALVAGDCAGGDHRGRLAAGIRVARKDVDGYWLELQVEKSDDAVVELARKYAELKHPDKGDWPGGKPPFEHPCPKRPKPVPPKPECFAKVKNSGATAGLSSSADPLGAPNHCWTSQQWHPRSLAQPQIKP